MQRLLPLLIVVALLPLGCSSGGDGGGGGAGGSADGAYGEDGGAADGSGGGGGGSAPAGGDGAALASERLPEVGERIIQTATIRMTARKGGLGPALERAREIADRLAGFVVRSASDVSRRGRSEQGAIVIRVPGRNYAAALEELSDVGRVESQRESAEGVSQEFVDLEARARHLRAVELQMLELLNRANSVPAALAVQDRLNGIQLELEQVRGRIRFLEDQTSYATISVSIRERGPVTAADSDGWGIVEAWRDGAQAFVRVAGRMFVVLAGGAPLVLLALLCLAIFRAARRSLLRWRPGPGV